MGALDTDIVRNVCSQTLGVQVLLETDGLLLCRKIQRYDNRPRTMERRVPARAMIVSFESRPKVVYQSQ